MSDLILIKVTFYTTTVIILFYKKKCQYNIPKELYYNVVLAITSAVRGFFMEIIYQELVLESLQQRRWYRKLCYFLN